jgi:hypothetical protein
MLNMKAALAALGFAVVVAGATVSPARAGEVTGNGKPTAAPGHANSICAFSGQNDTPNEAPPEGGRTQSYGQLVRQGAANPRAFNPGDACRGGSNTPGQP